MSAIEERIRIANETAEWLASIGQPRRAGSLRQISRSLRQASVDYREIKKLRAKLTPIGLARASEARRSLVDELRATADVLERMSMIAETGGEGVVGVEPPDTAYVVALLRRASQI